MSTILIGGLNSPLLLTGGYSFASGTSAASAGQFTTAVPGNPVAAMVSADGTGGLLQRFIGGGSKESYPLLSKSFNAGNYSMPTNLASLVSLAVDIKDACWLDIFANASAIDSATVLVAYFDTSGNPQRHDTVGFQVQSGYPTVDGKNYVALPTSSTQLPLDVRSSRRIAITMSANLLANWNISVRPYV